MVEVEGIENTKLSKVRIRIGKTEIKKKKMIKVDSKIVR